MAWMMFLEVARNPKSSWRDKEMRRGVTTTISSENVTWISANVVPSFWFKGPVNSVQTYWGSRSPSWRQRQEEVGSIDCFVISTVGSRQQRSSIPP